MGGCTLFGKLPWAADYVRMNHAHPAALALDAWLQASHQQIALAGAGWPRATLRFWFAEAISRAVVTGVLAPSRDRAGRSFPVALFATLPAAPLSARFARVPAALAVFHAAAERALVEAAHDKRAAERALEALRAPVLGDLDHHEGDDAIEAGALARSLFDHVPEQRLIGAAAALARAAWDMRGRSTVAHAPVLDLPVRAPGHVAAWLALLAPLRAARDAPPSLFWCDAPDAPRALVALASPPPSLLLWMAEPARRSARLRVLAEAPQGTDAARIREGLPATSYRLPADRFFSQVAAMFARGAAS